MGSTATLQFQWRGEKIKIKGKVARTTMKPLGGKPAYESAIQFGTTLDEAPDAMRKIMKPSGCQTISGTLSWKMMMS